MRPRIGVVLVAAGSGTRFGSESKVLTCLSDRPILQFALEAFVAVEGVRQIVIVAGQHTFVEVAHLAGQVTGPPTSVCLGGETRRDSVRLGLAELAADVEYVLVHDAARPFVDESLIERVISAAVTCGAAVPVLPVSDTLYEVDDSGAACGMQARDALRAVQTPQGVRRDWLIEALETPGLFTDEGSAILACGHPVMTVPGSVRNIKITWPDDVVLAEALLGGKPA